MKPFPQSELFSLPWECLVGLAFTGGLSFLALARRRRSVK